MKKYEHTKRFLPKYCEVDFKDELKISTVLSYMEEVACSSADELGFGYEYVKGKGYAFFVSNICCEFYKPIPLGREVVIKTWPTPPTYVIFGREYVFETPLGEVTMKASSRWCLMDMSTGKILQSKAIDNQDYSTYNDTKLLDNVQWKLPVFPAEEGELRFTLTVANSEYDHNMHVNNTRYADYCLNCFTVSELAKSRLKGFSISYVKQCKEGETLRFYRKKTENAWQIRGENGQGEVVVLALVVFED